MFKETLGTTKVIESISNDEASIIMSSGQYIITTFIGSQANMLLFKAIGVFTNLFEEQFEEHLKKGDTNVAKYESGKELIPKIFPFIQIKE